MTTPQWISQILSNLLDLGTIFSIILIIIGSMIIFKIGDKILLRIEKKHDINLTVHYLLVDILKYSIMIIAIGWILHLIGIDIQNIIISLGIASVVIGFASKDIVSNFISGLFVIGDKNIQVGDTIEVDGKKGAVTKVGFRNTTMIDMNNYKVTIPNSILSTKTYRNFPSKEDYRIRLEVILPHGLDIFEYKKMLTEEMDKYDWVNKEMDAVILAREMMEDGAKIEVSFWVKDYADRNPGKVLVLEESNKIIAEYLKTQ